MDNNFLVAGVGGQGALLASNILADIGVASGFDVKKAEVHGMSQRGGSVTSHIRWAKKVRSPVIPLLEVDYLLALEKLEGLRNVRQIKSGGTVLFGEVVIPPLTVSSGTDHYPSDDEIIAIVSEFTENLLFVPTITIGRNLGNPRVHNVVLLGAQSCSIPQIPTEIWLKTIMKHVPGKYIDLNLDAFVAGREFGFKEIIIGS
jgi:indolepyruvate ferredoxin oxidoreductase beta subunit